MSVESFVNEAHELHATYKLTKTSTWSSDEKYKHYREIYIKCDKLMEKWGTTVSDKPLVKMSDEEHKLRSTVLERLSELIEKCLTHKLQ